MCGTVCWYQRQDVAGTQRVKGDNRQSRLDCTRLDPLHPLPPTLSLSSLTGTKPRDNARTHVHVCPRALRRRNVQVCVSRCEGCWCMCLHWHALLDSHLSDCLPAWLFACLSVSLSYTHINSQPDTHTHTMLRQFYVLPH